MNVLDREICRLAFPSIMANITVPLVGMVDIAVAGHLGGGTGGAATLIGGISIGSMMFDMMYWSFGFLRAGTGGLSAQAYGRGDTRECTAVLYKGVLLSLLIALAVLAIQWPFSKLITFFVKTSPEVMRLALQYFFIRVWAAPATLSLMSFKGWFIGMQDSVSAMGADIIVNVVNIIASIVLSIGIPSIGFEGIGFAGISVGTVIAQYTGLGFVLAVLLLKYRGVLREGNSAGATRFDRKELGAFASLNSDLFVRSLCVLTIYISVTTISARFGDLLLATSSIMMNLLLLFSYFTDGFAFAGEALTGKYIGMRDRETVKRVVRKVFIWSLAISTGFIFVYFLGGDPMLHLMTSDNAVIEACQKYFVWLLPMPLIGCIAFTYDGIYIGATASVAMRDSGLLSVLAFYVAWIALLPFSDGSYLGLHFLMAAYFAHLFVRSLYMWVKYRKEILTRPFQNVSADTAAPDNEAAGLSS